MVDYGAERLTFIDLFAGCGGLSLGFTWAGFTPIQSVEWDKHAAATHSVNIGGEIFAGDIADWLEGAPPNADVILGGPPCQGFSQLGAQNPDDPRNSLWDQYVDALVAVEPRYFVLENVPAFLKSKQFDALVTEMAPGERLEGYEIEHYVLDASHYGVPQSRRRAAGAATGSR